MTTENGLPIEEAVQLVGDFLPSWREVKTSDVHVNKIHGGYVNSVYVLEKFTEGFDDNNNQEPSKLLVRKTGNGILDREAFKEYTIHPSLEVLAAQEVSRRGFGPVLYGVFDGGRIEEFLEGHTLTHLDVKDPAIVKCVAQAYARFHSIKLPFPTRNEGPPVLIKPSQEGIKKVIDKGYDITSLFDIDWNARKDWILDEMKSINSRVTLCQWDTNFLNVFVRDKPKDGQQKVVLIDYEVVNYRFRGSDIGGHFCSRMFQWANEGNKLTGSLYPTVEERKAFIKDYLEETAQLRFIDDFNPNGRDSVNQVLKESILGSMMYFFCTTTFYAIALDMIVSHDPSLFGPMKVFMETYDKLMEEYKESV